MKILTHFKYNGHSVHFFRNQKSAYRHIRDHLLTYPECLMWNLVNPDELFENIFRDDSTYFYHLKILQEGDVQLFRLLYEYYLDSVERQLISAMKLGWTSHETKNIQFQTPDVDPENENRDNLTENIEKISETIVMMSVSGALILIEGTKEKAFYCVKTAYLAGQGDMQGIVESRHPDNSNAPVKRVFREKKAAQKKHSKRREEFEKQRRENFSREEKIYYDVFRSSWQWIRQSYDSNRDSLGNPCGTDFAALKSIVPKLTFAKWLEKFTEFN